jgi:hypothetical protein
MIDLIIGFFANNKYAMALSICAMLLSIFSLVYNRKNVKMQQYVETITSERIKWISDLRNNFSEIISYLYLSVYVEKEGDEWWNEYTEYRDQNELVTRDDAEEDLEVSMKIKRFRDMARKETSDENNVLFIKRVDALIMKLNDQDEDDKKLIRMLGEAKTLPFFLFEKGEIINKIDELKKMMRLILKNEWERVKKEVQKGGLVNGKRKNFFN